MAAENRVVSARRIDRSIAVLVVSVARAGWAVP